MDHNTSRNLFVTGTTGFLGRHFLYWQAQEPLHFIALVRGRNRDKAQRRLLESIKIAYDSYHAPFDSKPWSARTSVLVGDICDPFCGLSNDEIEGLRSQSVAQAWHFAASLNFEEKSQKKIWRQNVQGTANVLRLIDRAGIKEFVYCSTAYTVGKASGLVPERIHELPREFGNLYEESKCMAEHEVIRFCRDRGIKWSILRPSIVIGPRATKGTGGSTSGLYGFLQSFFKLETPLRAINHRITLLGNGDAKLNLVPVDDLMQDIRELARTGLANESILHLTSNWYPSIRKALRHASQLMGIRELEIAEAPGSRSLLERLVDGRTKFYSSYLKSEAEFERSLPRKYGVDNKEFAGYITEAYRDAKNESPKNIFDPQIMESFDGTQVKVFSAGDRSKPVAVLVNAIGMPVEFWSRFAKQLSDDFFVLTWETRACPNVDLSCDVKNHSFTHHVHDMFAVLDRFEVDEASIVGWCSGAQIALKGASTHPERVRRVASVNGSFGGAAGVPMTVFEEKLREVMPKIAKDWRMAEIYFNVVYGNRVAGGVDHADLHEKNEQASAVLTSVDPALLHLTSRPFESVESLFRYSRMIAASLNEDVSQWIGHVNAPVLLYTGKRDVTAHPECTRWVAQRLRDASLMIDDDGDHFTFYEEPSVCDRVRSFLRQGVAAQVA
jgi:nucleoside-diphosphate-sugar epimerase/pimeloyl-ACP methyl ester carboxylesterase